MLDRVPFLFGVLITLVSCPDSVCAKGIAEIRGSLAGPVGSDRVAGFLREAGVADPSSLAWRADAGDAQIGAWFRFRDVDRDGLPDAFLGLYDGRLVHWVLLRGRGPRDWGDPAYLTTTSYAATDVDPVVTERRLGQLCPRSRVCSGRVLVFHSSHASGPPGMVPDRHEVFELTGEGFHPLIMRATGGAYENRVEEWPMATETPGELVFFRWSENFRHGARLLLMRRVAPGARATGPTEEVTHDRVERLRPVNAPSANRPDIDEPTHPEIIAFKLARDRREALGSDVWRDLGIDPRSFRLFDLAQETEHPINAAVSYQDVDEDGDPEAWVVLEYLGSHDWILMDRDADDAWTAIGMRGSLWIEFGTRYFQNSPPTPRSHRVAGRTLLVYSSGSTWDQDSEIQGEVCLFEHGALTELWSEVTSGHRFDTQRLGFSEDEEGAVRFEVKTYESWGFEESALKKRRVWMLPAGSDKLESITD